MQTDPPIQALIQLLPETGKSYEIVRRKLIEIGPSSVPLLQEAAHLPSLSEKASEIVRAIRLHDMDAAWQSYTQNTPDSLEEGVFLLARFYNPSLDSTRYRQMIDQMAQTLRQRIHPNDRPMTLIRTLTFYLFEEMGFAGERVHYDDPENSYIHTLLDRKRGIPVSLSVLVLLLAERLSLPIFGIGLPRHFIVGWRDAEHEIFFDPFNGGKTLTRDEIRNLLARWGLVLREAYLQKASARQILERVMHNLIYIYAQRGATEEKAWLSRFCRRVHLSSGATRAA
jgi:regulator of sirC expression with transglutaminase-like and TPR domain